MCCVFIYVHVYTYTYTATGCKAQHGEYSQRYCNSCVRCLMGSRLVGVITVRRVNV